MVNSLLVGSLISGGTQILGNLLTKPSEREPSTAYLDKYINRLKGDLGRSELQHNVMRGAMRNIGAQTAQAKRLNDYSLSKYGNQGSGIAAQQRLSTQRTANKAINTANLEASRMQLQQDEQIRGKIREAELMKGRIRSQVEAENEAAESNWEKRMLSSVVQAGGQVASSYVQNEMQMRSAYDTAKAKGFEGSLPEFKSEFGASGYTSPSSFSQAEIQNIEPALNAAKALGFKGDEEQFVKEYQQMGFTDPNAYVQWFQSRRKEFGSYLEASQYESNRMNFQEYMDAIRGGNGEAQLPEEIIANVQRERDLQTSFELAKASGVDTTREDFEVAFKESPFTSPKMYTKSLVNESEREQKGKPELPEEIVSGQWGEKLTREWGRLNKVEQGRLDNIVRMYSSDFVSKEEQDVNDIKGLLKEKYNLPDDIVATVDNKKEGNFMLDKADRLDVVNRQIADYEKVLSMSNPEEGISMIQNYWDTTVTSASRLKGDLVRLRAEQDKILEQLGYPDVSGKDTGGVY